MSETVQDISLNVKGPSELKLSLTIASDQTVRQLKERIESEKADFAADAQRLIYAGKVLKDEEVLATYKIKNGHTIHMVRSASRPAPAAAGTGTGTGTGASSSNSNSSASQNVPPNFSAGQTFTNNPLSALNRADYAGPHMARLLNESGGGMLGGMGINPRDPNMMLNMLQNPEVQRQMRDLMSRPEFIDQMIAMNPQLQSMGPQMREMMQSEHFRNMITNPEAIQRMTQMSQLFGGLGAGGGAPQQQQQFPPPGAFGTGTGTGTGTGEQQTQTGTGGNPLDLFGGAGGAGGANPFAAAMAALGGGGGAGAGAGPLGDAAMLQQLLGLGGGAGAGAGAGAGVGAGAGAAQDSRAPEERYATQLEQMQAMGFYDGASNLRALLLSGGSVEGAIGVLLDSPNPGANANANANANP